MTPAKREMIRQQVISKVKWGASEREVVQWLAEKHGFAAAQAGDFLAVAYAEKKEELRGHAWVSLVFSGIGILLIAGFIYIIWIAAQWWLGMVFIVVMIAMFKVQRFTAIFTVGFHAVGTFFRSAAHLSSSDNTHSSEIKEKEDNGPLEY